MVSLKLVILGLTKNLSLKISKVLITIFKLLNKVFKFLEPFKYFSKIHFGSSTLSLYFVIFCNLYFNGSAHSKIILKQITSFTIQTLHRIRILIILYLHFNLLL